jgi:serine kinase of HPr protein (carbohydrate metabolism regulator)
VILHAGLIARRQDGAWRGVLLLGEAGAGKSDLMLRALAQGFRLVADDRVLLWRSGGALFGRAPERLAGLIELRGLGVVEEPALPLAEVGLAVRCEPPGGVERMPEPEVEEIGGVRVRVLRLHALDASAPAKLGRALNRLGRGGGAA